MGKIVRTLSKDGLVLCCAVDSTDAISRMEQIHGVFFIFCIKTA